MSHGQEQYDSLYNMAYGKEQHDSLYDMSHGKERHVILHLASCILQKPQIDGSFLNLLHIYRVKKSPLICKAGYSRLLLLMVTSIQGWLIQGTRSYHICLPQVIGHKRKPQTDGTHKRTNKKNAQLGIKRTIGHFKLEIGD